MYIIIREADADGARQPLLAWNNPTAPKGFALCPDAFCNVFYSTTPAGFVNITVKGDTVTAMTVNWDAYNAYVADHPAEPEPQAEPTADELINAMLGVFNV